ncbi:MAG: UvrB/UvrC motif-containing protein [Planctomycetes bacterium]|nr:UvrB/UvrC motif-containing protein [Planctomycetota bacterium]
MKCQSCQTRAATVHFTELLDGGLKEMALCEECYAVKKPAGTDELGMLATALGAPTAAGAGTASVGPDATGDAGSAPDDPISTTCSHCGLTYAMFRSRGRLGCPLCYEAFRTALEPLLEKIHGGKSHVGKTPLEGASRDRAAERALVALRRKLQDAIKQENYELAASLRDELRRAEEGISQSEGGGES